MSRQEKLSQSHFRIESVRSSELKRALGKFSDLFRVCCGPQGKVHMVRNACGGHVTVTGSCCRLLETMMITRPELKLLVSSVQAHLQGHGDGGLFMMTVCSQLVLASADSDHDLLTLTSLYKTFVHYVISYLCEPECPVKVTADFSNLSTLLGYVKSVMRSKSLLNLSCSDCDHVSHLILKTFLESIPCTDKTDIDTCVSDRVYFLTLDDLPISTCKLEAGLLLRYPDISCVQGARNLNVIYNSLPPSCQRSGPEMCVRVCLLVCSMSGDMEEVTDAHFELCDEAAVERGVIETLQEFSQSLEQCGVGLLLCQKVIHPKVKVLLRSKGIIFVDRLGSQIIPYIQDLTGAKPLRCTSDTTLVPTSLGWVSSVDHVIMAGRGFLSISQSEPCVNTLVLCAPWEERLQELKICVRAALQGLSQLATTKSLLMGAGCWQAHSTQMLNDKVLSELSLMAKTYHCTESLVLEALSIFCRSLHAWLHSLVSQAQESLAVDPVSLHLWSMPHGGGTTLAVCRCGRKTVEKHHLQNFEYLSRQFSPTSDLMYNFRSGKAGSSIDVSVVVPDSNIVVDNFSTSISALRQAVSTAGLLLSIGQFISDKN